MSPYNTDRYKKVLSYFDCELQASAPMISLLESVLHEPSNIPNRFLGLSITAPVKKEY
ncbi:MAG: hypothetical protein O2833_00780 [Proteobacteria bacterium]|nr:hypothetical protein [Pseudomonadota bacterium]